MMRIFKDFKISIFSRLVTYFLLVAFIILVIVNGVSTKITNSEIKKQFILSTNQELARERDYMEALIKSVDIYCNQLMSDSEFYDLLTHSNSELTTYLDILLKARKRMDSIVLSDVMIDGIQIINPGRISLSSPTSSAGVYAVSETKVKAITQTDFYNKAMELNDRYLFLPPHIDTIKQSDPNIVISCVKSLNFLLDGNKSAIIIINLKPKIIQENMSKVKIGKDGYMLIVDQHGNIISHPDSSLFGINAKDEEYVKQTLDKDMGQFVYKDNKSKKNMFTIYTSSTFTGWKYVAVVPEKELSMLASKITSNLSIISILSFILTIFVSLIVSLSISRPINNVIKAMNEVENGNLNAEVKYNSKDEIGKLSEGFNSMVERINILIEEEYEFQILINKVKLELLQMQINPHLLYNTLAMVSHVAKKENKYQIVEIVENLSNIYKGILSKGKTISTFKAEVNMIKRYIDLMKEVYGINIDVIFDVDDSIYELYTLKLLLQPIVENSIMHGIKPKKSGTLVLSMYIKQNIVEVLISDDGMGMDKKIVDELNNITSYKDIDKGYGISNVIKRIKLFFGNEYGVNIKSDAGVGTNVIIRLPIIEKNEIDAFVKKNMY